MSSVKKLECLRIAMLGNPVLRKMCQSVPTSEICSPSTKSLITAMKNTLLAEEGVGLAAPQVSHNQRIVLIREPIEPGHLEHNQHAPEELDKDGYTLISLSEPIVLINPVVTQHSDSSDRDWEMCLSIPGFVGLVSRWLSVNVAYMNTSGVECTTTLSKYAARVFQHELDHLNGKLFLERLVSSKHLLVESEYNRLLDEDPRVILELEHDADLTGHNIIEENEEMKIIHQRIEDPNTNLTPEKRENNIENAIQMRSSETQ